MLTYLKLLKLIEGMSDHQKEMEVCVLINDDYHHMSAMLHVDADFREATEDNPDFVHFEEDQPILT